MREKALADARNAEEKGLRAVINAALLEEMDFVPSCDIVVLVTAPYEKRLERALFRDGMTADAFRARSDAQKDIGLSLFSSGKRMVTIFNNSGMEDLRKQAEYFSEALA